MSTVHKLMTQEELLQAKDIRSHELAMLSIEEKIAVLIRMQQLESDIARHVGREHPEPWNLQASGKSKQ